MGNQLTGLSPSQILPIEHYLEHHLPASIWSQSTLKSHLGSTRFMKVARIAHEVERDLVVKIFVIPEKLQDVELIKYITQIRDITTRLNNPPNCLPWTQIEQGEKAGFLIRQFISRSLYDRLSTRPFLTVIEKKWAAYQLIQALVTIHDHGIVHGDLKCENILLTRDDWLLLSDFASFKPVHLPSDNPGMVLSILRAACLAPERFINIDDVDMFPSSSTLEAPMDIFAAGCIVAEIFNDGQPLFSYGELLSFAEGKTNPDLSSLPEGIRDLVQEMIRRSPKERPKAKELLKHSAFNSIFDEYLYRAMRKYKEPPKVNHGIRGDDIVRAFKVDVLEMRPKLSPEEYVIPLNLILAAVHHCDFHFSKFNAFQILIDMVDHLTDQIVLERIVPTFLKFTRDSDSRIRSKALLSLCSVLIQLDPEKVSRKECELFSDFLLRDLSPLAQDSQFHVKRNYARVIGSIGEVAYRFAARCIDAGDDIHVALVREKINEHVTTIMTDISAEVKREFLHSSVIKLAGVLGAENLGDTVLKHMITYLNCKQDWQLRAEFYTCLPKVVNAIGLQGHLADVLGALIQQGLVDSEDSVISRALDCFTQLIESNLMSKTLALEVADKAAPFLLHPNSAILINAANFFAALAGSINTAEKLVQLVPKVTPFLKRKNNAAVDSAQALLTFLRPPLSRHVYDILINSGYVSECVELIASNPTLDLTEMQSALATDEKLIETIKEAHPKYNTASTRELEQVKSKLSKLIIRLDNSTHFSADDRTALLLMKDFIIKQTQHRLALAAVSESNEGTDKMMLNQVERENGYRVRNYAALTIEKSQNEKEKDANFNPKNIWRNPYFSNQRPIKKTAHQDEEPEPLNQLRYSQSKIALRELIYKKRHACRVKMVEDLMDVSIDWDTNAAAETWIPKGRLVAHVHEHSAAVNQISLNLNNTMMCSSSDDCTVRLWNTAQFSSHSQPSSFYKSRNVWRSADSSKVKRASFCDTGKLCAATHGGGIYYLDIENFKTGPIWTKHLDSKRDGVITDMITAPDIEHKGQIICSTSCGSIIGIDIRSGKETFRLGHELRHGVITSICGDKRQRWVAAASSRGFVSVWDLRFQLKCRSFQVSDHQNKINKMICHPVRSSQVAISIDGNNDVGIWSLESGLRESAFFASQNVPPLSQDRDPQGYTIKSILFSADASVLFTGGNDRRIRAWSLVDPAKSNIVAQAASDQADGLRHDVIYHERKLEGVNLILEERKVRRIASEESDWGLTGPPQGHWDLISSLQILHQNDKLLISSSRDGIIKVWK